MGKALRRDADFVFKLSAFGLAAELVIALTTVLPSAPVIPQWPVFVLFPGIFVVHLRSVTILSRRRGHRLELRDLLRGLPTVVRLAFVGLFIVAWFVALTSILHIGGQPKEVHGHYYLNDHGSLIPVTHSEYLHALVLQQRIFTLIPAVFYALGVIVNWPAGPTLASRAVVGESPTGGFADLATADHHEIKKDTTRSIANAMNDPGVIRRRPRMALIIWVLCLMFAYGLYFSITTPTVRAWLHIGSPLPSCESAQISTPEAREGECARGDGLFSPATVYNVVNHSHILRLPEYQVRLLGSRIAHTRVTGPSSNAAYYSDGHGLLVSYELTITNPGDRPLPFGSETHGLPRPFYPKHSRSELAIPSSPGSEGDLAFEEIINGRGAPGPSIVEQGTIPAHGVITGWVTFVAPSWAGAVLDTRPADLDLFRIDHDPHYVGQIRLWK